MERLAATIRNYDWGDPAFIPQLQGRVASGVPEAELWMGAHPSAPGRLMASDCPLDEVIAADPVAALGDLVADQFGRLPFLAKVLAAAKPLSIQAHPSLQQAASGFERENAEGLEIDSPLRTYRDANHKPELLCALTRFEVKAGLRTLDLTRELFSSLGAGVASVTERLSQSGTDPEILADVLDWLLRLGPTEVAELVAATVEASVLVSDGRYAPDLTWSARLSEVYPGDVGVVVALLLNHVVLQPGQALFLDAGNLHCYLKGAGVEVMANSDNVVRCGLTSKHIDVGELLSIASFAPVSPAVQTPEDAVHQYDVPVSEFSLARVELRGEVRFRVVGPEILVVTEGNVALGTGGSDQVSVGPGEPVWIPASDKSYTASGDAMLFRITVG